MCSKVRVCVRCNVNVLISSLPNFNSVILLHKYVSVSFILQGYCADLALLLCFAHCHLIMSISTVCNIRFLVIQHEGCDIVLLILILILCLFFDNETTACNIQLIIKREYAFLSHQARDVCSSLESANSTSENPHNFYIVRHL
jgi:hypothetical protein